MGTITKMPKSMAERCKCLRTSILTSHTPLSRHSGWLTKLRVSPRNAADVPQSRYFEQATSVYLRHHTLRSPVTYFIKHTLLLGTLFLVSCNLMRQMRMLRALFELEVTHHQNPSQNSYRLPAKNSSANFKEGFEILRFWISPGTIRHSKD
jgi:hypothetical protein